MFVAMHAGNRYSEAKTFETCSQTIYVHAVASTNSIIHHT